ncbi:hypothetical protein IWQ60_003403 [Tieghemiomyces parasiticus]|uniref:t-SNARE coiled-coil homology domain-containing protein n=1 Tax=Tieghemiomyces parasiticus TaxID=78921 RepID=A0A9W8DWG8_9FUNG|nr:hypothetical protein IWQ60_003403 [Tieghemiomyces parasiticus]
MADITDEFVTLLATAAERQASNSSALSTGGPETVSEKPLIRRRQAHDAWAQEVRRAVAGILAGRDPFMAEAYRLLRHIESLRQFLHATRGAYLDIGAKRGRANFSTHRARTAGADDGSQLMDSLHRLASSTPAAHAPVAASSGPAGSSAVLTGGTSAAATAETPGISAQDMAILLQQARSSHMTDQERDEIDQQAKFIIRQCLDRIKRLEAFSRAAAEEPAPSATATGLFGLFSLSSRSSYGVLKRETLAAHHGAVLWLLNKRLMDVSMFQRDQQEMRLNRALAKQGGLQPRRSYWAKRQAEKQQQKLDSPRLGRQDTIGAARFGATAPFGLGFGKPTELGDEKAAVDTDAFFDHELRDGKAVASPVPFNQRRHDPIDDYWGNAGLPEDDGHKDGATEAVSSSHQMELQEENRALLREFEDTLTQVRSAEQALLEISALQSTLSTHLAMQTEQTERLHSEAMATSERVQEGNEQLLEARQRNADTRKWILIFLIMASLVLLFLDWFD